MRTEEVQTEEQLEASLNELAAKIAAGEIELENEEPPKTAEEEPAVDEVDHEEAKAKADGHVSYDEWVQSGKDPRAWRPAAEFNRRGEMLRTPKPELIETVEQLRQQQEEVKRLLQDQARITREAAERAREEGYQRAIAEAREKQDLAIKLGDTDAARKAFDEEQSARDQMRSQAADPTRDPELLSWQDQTDWFKNGFGADGKPKDAYVETFLEFQKAHMLANPQSRLVDSVRAAEAKVKRLLPDFYKPKTAQVKPVAPAVESGARAAKPSVSNGLERFSASEQAHIKACAKAFGIPVAEYVKQIG